MAIYRLGNHTPRIAASAWVADSAQVIGMVELAEDASIWFGTILRGDTDRLVIGRGTNIQDGSVVHADPGFAAILGAGVSVGHQVMLHGCTIGDHSLIGIQSVVLNGARIGRWCLVGAGSLVTEGKSFPDGSLIMGRPAKVVREISAEQRRTLQEIAAGYVESARRFRAELVRLQDPGSS